MPIRIHEIPRLLEQAVSRHKTGRVRDAGNIYRKILKSFPNHPDANHLLGILYHQTGRTDAGLKHMRKALRLKPEIAHYHLSLGNALLAEGKFEEASLSFRKSLELRPDYVPALVHLGSAYDGMGRADEAIACLQKALEIAPHYVPAYNNLANVLMKEKKFEEAASLLKTAVDLHPDFHEGWNNLGNALCKLEQYTEALEQFHRAVSLHPGYATAYYNMGNTYARIGEQEKAIAGYRKALEADPGNIEAHTALLFALNYHPAATRQEIYLESCRWAEAHAAALAPSRPKPGRRNADRLRIGYISADFRRHPVAYFLMPVLEHHDRSRIESFCYSSNGLYDEISRKCEELSDHWLQCENMPDQALAERVRADRIDILVDLSGHTVGNRLLVFARKPAPVQVNWLGYVATTGLKTMNYRLTSIDADPPGSEKYYTEQLYRFTNHLWWCYRPQPDMPSIQPAPALKNNRITFGYTNNYAKITGQLIEAMIAILNRTPDSRLVMAGVPEGSVRSILLARFTGNGIEKERLTIHGTMDLQAFWDLHHDIDIVLDSFPYNGGTTTCDALWLGTPVVTKIGESFVSRMGFSHVKNIGLPGLAASTWEEYVGIATRMAGDRKALNELRLSLRQRMTDSPLCDVSGFTRELENGYRWMWHEWCIKEHQT